MPNETMLLIAGLIAGLLAPFATQLMKGGLGLKGLPALYLAFLMALALGVVIALGLGVTLPVPGTDPPSFFVKVAELAAVAFSLATLIYKTWLAKIQPEGPLALFANKPPL